MKKTALIANDYDCQRESFFSSRDLRIWLPGQVVSKLRPRFGKGTAFLHPNYREWKNRTVTKIIAQLQCNSQTFDLERCMVSQYSPTALPITSARVSVLFVGGHRGDPDNRFAAIIDSLVASGILVNDTASHNPAGRYETVNSRLHKGALVIVEPANIPKFCHTMLREWGR
ncbi:MAG TPA: hypothetical protein V6D28_06610 [Leptolyngbyaceae cyanobacterium]